MNKESCWQDCLDLFTCIKTRPNKGKVSSIIHTAIGRIKFLEEIKIKEDNANYIFEGYYSSILELLHALTMNKGYKVNNHLCLGYYLREILEKKKLYRVFDDLRIKRNNLLYYGNKMNFDISLEAILNCKFLFSELLKSVSNIR